MSTTTISTTITTFDDLKHLLAFIYIIPSLILYLIILYLIFFSSIKQNFNGSFYWIFGFSAINNIIHAISYYITFRFTRIPLFNSFLETWPTESVWYLIVYAVMCYSASALRVYNFVLSFNRVTIFLLKNNHSSFWKRYLKYFLYFCVFAPLIFVWHFPFIGIKNQPMEGWVVFIGPTITDFVPWFDRARNLFIQILITSIVELIMNFYFIYGFIKWRNSVSVTNKHLNKQNQMMFVYSMLIFLTESLSCIQQCMNVIDPMRFANFKASTQYILADISTLAPVWFLIATNKPMREAILHNYVNKVSSFHLQPPTSQRF